MHCGDKQLRVTTQGLRVRDPSETAMLRLYLKLKPIAISLLPSLSLSPLKPTRPLINYLPESSQGSVLVTARDNRIGKRLGSKGIPIVVGYMNLQEGQELLRSQLDQTDDLNTNDSRALIDTLGYIPLAITQAAAFIEQNNITLTKYLGTDHTTETYHEEELTPTVRIVHFSVQEYLKSERIQHQKAAIFHLTSVTAHGEIAQICLTYLLEHGLSSSNLDQSLLEEFPLAKFAAMYWYHHYQATAKHDPGLWDCVNGFYNYFKCHFRRPLSPGPHLF